MIDRQSALSAQPERPLPVDGTPPLDPRDRTSSRVAARDDGKAGEVSGGQVLGNAANLLTLPGTEGGFQCPAEWAGVNQSPKRRPHEAPT